jgi:hypothetical protein
MSRDRIHPFLAAIGVFAVLHHADHVLRADHSGWPFQPEVTPFTFSLLVYPVLLIDYLVINNPRLRVGLLSGGLTFLVLVHVTIETPVDLFRTWSTGASTSEANPGVPNLLGLASPAAGVAANLVLALLFGALVAALAMAHRPKVAVGPGRLNPAQMAEVD